ncbi:TetR family transcriptional regulator [Streptomyces sp. NBC_00154]|nr:TetR family transcriptional regulator [Streptomyces sp. NBC_00154]MCX5317645.1 TetR family transcriptional regulator [Streptomyces sp. NBC_00154]
MARAADVSKATIHLRWKAKTELAAAALKTLRPLFHAAGNRGCTS